MLQLRERAGEPHASRRSSAPLRRLAAPAAALVALWLPACKTRPYVDGPVSEYGGQDASVTTGSDLAHDTFCGTQDFREKENVRPDLIVIQDRSGSMNNGINDQRFPPPGQSKWELMRAAIQDVVTIVPSVDWGLMLFGTDNQCGAPTVPNVPVGPGTAETIKGVLAATNAGGRTPTTAAINNAVTYFKGLADRHPHYLLLSTDGEPDCANGMPGPGMRNNDDAAAELAVAAAAKAGIPTFVVGIGANTNADQVLTTMAQNGGVPNNVGNTAYYSVSSTSDLVSVLESVASKIKGCTYPLDHIPADQSLVSVEDGQGVIARDPTHLDGWDFGPDGASVIFYGATCAKLENGIIIDAHAIYKCPMADQ